MIIVFCVVIGVCVAAGFVAKAIIENQSDKNAELIISNMKLNDLVNSNEVKISELLTELNAAHNKLVAIADLTKIYHD